MATTTTTTTATSYGFPPATEPAAQWLSRPHSTYAHPYLLEQQQPPQPQYSPINSWSPNHYHNGFAHRSGANHQPLQPPPTPSMSSHHGVAPSPEPYSHAWRTSRPPPLPETETDAAASNTDRGRSHNRSISASTNTGSTPFHGYSHSNGHVQLPSQSPLRSSSARAARRAFSSSTSSFPSSAKQRQQHRSHSRSHSTSRTRKHGAAKANAHAHADADADADALARGDAAAAIDCRSPQLNISVAGGGEARPCQHQHQQHQQFQLQHQDQHRHRHRHSPDQQRASQPPAVLSPRPIAAAPSPSPSPWSRMQSGPDPQPDLPGGTPASRLEAAPPSNLSLSLYIPDADEQRQHQHQHNKDLPRISPAHTPSLHDGHAVGIAVAQSARTPHPTSLPSFAHFRDSTARSDGSDEVEIAPMSSRLACTFCSRLKPMLSEVAYRVADLDENIQVQCNKAISRAPDCPQDSPVRAAEWIIGRLQLAKRDLDEALQQQRLAPYRQDAAARYPGMPPVHASPSSALKRHADYWDDGVTLKRARSANESPETLSRVPSGPTIKDDHRASFDSIAPKDHMSRLGFSPLCSESMLESSYPHAPSPAPHRAQGRALPSPSSVAYAPSVAPSLINHSGSPLTAYNQPPPLHASGFHPVTSQHIADLQHQVSLKSLALQTLEAEHSQLLQKVQRDRVKSQIIERKTSVADREVNELTSRNEELTEQVKALQKQLEDSEKKRDDVNADAKREKEQWSRMLDMSSRLQNKHAEDKQKLADENSKLSQRVAAAEDELAKSNALHCGTKSTHSDRPTIDLRSTSDVATVREQNDLLKARLDILHTALDESRRYHHDVLDRMQKEYTRLQTALDAIPTDQMIAAPSDPSAEDLGATRQCASIQPTTSPRGADRIPQASDSLPTPTSALSADKAELAVTKCSDRTPAPAPSISRAAAMCSEALEQIDAKPAFSGSNSPPTRFGNERSSDESPASAPAARPSPPTHATHTAPSNEQIPFQPSPASMRLASPFPSTPAGITGPAGPNVYHAQGYGLQQQQQQHQQQQQQQQQHHHHHYSHHHMEASRGSWSALAMPPPPRPV